jgi:hypothetical protein
MLFWISTQVNPISYRKEESPRRLGLSYQTFFGHEGVALKIRSNRGRRNKQLLFSHSLSLCSLCCFPFLQVMKNNHFESLFKLFSWNIINVVGVVDDDLSDWNFVFVFANQVLLFLFLNERSNSKIVFLLFNVFLLPVEKNKFLALSLRPYLLLFDNWILSF